MPALSSPYGPIDFQRDALGYPSMRARDFVAGTWARGWFHAHDRLVQIHLALAVARGRALELLGDTPLARLIARGVLLHGFDRDATEQIARIAPRTREMIDAYCAGFAAGVRVRGWPFVLRLARIPPAPLRAEDIVLTYRLVSWFGLTSLHEWAELIVAELAADGVAPQALALLLGDATSAAELAAIPRVEWPPELRVASAGPIGGSNAIAIAASRSKTGTALLLGDPHMEIARIPPVLYAMHVDHADGSYLQGLGVPGLPWPSFGRTAHVGWSYTYGHGDVIDTFAVRCRRGEAWDGARWRSLARRDVDVQIKRRKRERWTFWDGPHGAAVGDAGAADERVLPFVRWAGLGETWRDLDAAREMLDARDVGEAARAQKLATISLNAVLADASGRVAYVATGRVDARPASAGGVVPRSPDGDPVPMPDSARPIAIDPPSGFVVSANDRPAGAKHWVPLPEPRYRYERLRELVAAGPADLRDLARFACDAVDAGARRMLAAWAPHLPDDPHARALVVWGAAQPGRGAAHFAAATRYVALHHEAARALVARHVGAARAARLLDELGGLALFQHHVDDALALDRPDVLDATALRELLAIAWPRALARERDPARKLPVATPFVNAVFGGKLPRVLNMDSPPFALPGGPTTPNQCRAVDILGARMVFGSAGRYLVDLGKPGGWYCIAGGASERRFGPGYGKGIAAWAAGTFAPLGAATGAPPDAAAST